MSLFSDIANIVGIRPAPSGGTAAPANSTTGAQQPASPNPATSPQRAGFGSAFSSTFNSTLATVFERGAAGDFEDRTLVLEEQAALQRLRQAQLEARAATRGTAGSVVGGGGPVEGASAAPTPNEVADTSAGTGPSLASEQREVYAVRVRQSEARLSKVSSSLKQEYPKAAQLASASTGTWDPATFVPRTAEQAEAFAQRLVIDVTEAAARLEIVKTQLDEARFELQQGGGAAVRREVAELEAAYRRQTAYVDKLAKIVDEQSGGELTEAGIDVRNGNTLRTEDDLPVDEIAAALHEIGYSDEQITRVLGASETVVEEAEQPGGSQRLRAINDKLSAALLDRFNDTVRRHEQEFQRQEEERAERRRDDDKRIERRRSETQAQEQSLSRDRQQQIAAEQAAVQRNAQRAADFERWMQQLVAQHAGQRRHAG